VWFFCGEFVVDGGEFLVACVVGEKRLWFWDFFVVGEAVARRLFGKGAKL
jgi:hypothetical protein